MIPADSITRRAWATYLELNRRSNVQYAHLPTITGRVADAPRTRCACGRGTQAKSGVCRRCQED